MTRKEKIKLLQQIALGVQSADNLKDTSAVIIKHANGLYANGGISMTEAQMMQYTQDMNVIIILPHNGR